MARPATNRAQYERLVEMMQERSDIAQGFPNTSKENVQSFWEEVGVQLNSLGPPIKDTTTWKKVWLDYKSAVKRKLTSNKQESQATGGGRNRMHTFNSLEETVIRITALETSTEGIEGTNRYGRKQNPSAVGNASSSEPPIESDNLDCSMQSTPEDASSRRYSGSQRQDTTKLLLEKQLKLQEDFNKVTTEFYKRSEEKMDKLNEKFCRLNTCNEELLEEVRRHNVAMETLKREEIDRTYAFEN